MVYWHRFRAMQDDDGSVPGVGRGGGFLRAPDPSRLIRCGALRPPQPIRLSHFQVPLQSLIDLFYRDLNMRKIYIVSRSQMMMMT